VTALVNGSGSVVERYVYDPYGKQSIYDSSYNSRASSSYAWIFGLQGKRIDSSTGNYNFNAREYRPTLSRFLRNDPTVYGAGDPNLYRTEWNRPINNTDPLGLWVWTWETDQWEWKDQPIVQALTYCDNHMQNVSLTGPGSIPGKLGATPSPSFSSIGESLWSIIQWYDHGMHNVSLTGPGSIPGHLGAAPPPPAGPLWNSPNTLLGLIWAGIGSLTGHTTWSTENNAIVVENHPFMMHGSGITLGNVIIYQGEATSDLSAHEHQHIIQGYALGPFYLPSHLLAGVYSLVHTGNWHEGNILEWGPESDPPKPWSLELPARK
jgi:RHS repeat-associated protein